MIFVVATLCSIAQPTMCVEIRRHIDTQSLTPFMTYTLTQDECAKWLRETNRQSTWHVTKMETRRKKDLEERS